MIIITMNSGGKRIDSVHRPDNPPSLNINTRLYTGIKYPRPGRLAFLNTLHREIIMNTAIARDTTIHNIAIHPNNAHKTVVIPTIVSGFMLPVNACPSSSKEKFIDSL